MSTSERTVVIAIGAAALAACASLPPAPGKPPAFGAAVSAEEIARWDISIPPSGAGLPKGGGSARQGLKVYGIGSLAGKTPQRTVGSYWPYATTLFDYVRRAMPITNPLSLTDDEVYAVSAYVLFLNGIVGEDAVMSAQTLPQVKMPNRDGFVSDWPPRARD